MAEQKPAEGRAYVEIQYHPRDIRRGVRYLFLDRRRLRRWAIGLGLLAAFLLTGLLLAPLAISDAWARYSYGVELEQRERLGERLRSLSGELADLAGRAEELRVEMHRVHLAYGLDSDAAEGIGGFPTEPDAPVGDSVYADLMRHGLRLEAVAREELEVLGSFIAEVREFEAAHQSQIATTPSTCPLRGEFVLTSPFGTRRNPFTKEVHFHSGLDLAASVGTPIHAPADGVVVFAGRYPLRQSVPWWRFGNLVALRNGERFITLFGHCEEVLVESGDEVRQGDVIATVGSTGWSTSPHLHYEVRALNAEGEFEPVDPRIYILDHRWADQERLLVRARSAPDPGDFEPLPGLIGEG